MSENLFQQLVETLHVILERLDGMDKRLVAIERNIDLLTYDAQRHRLVDAAATPLPRRPSCPDLSWDD